MPAFDPMDIAINSGLSLLELRDVTLARGCLEAGGQKRRWRYIPFAEVMKKSRRRSSRRRLFIVSGLID
jgi:hypothetical protein